MKKLKDEDYLDLVIDVGNCFVADNAYQINDDVREATLKVAKHFVSFEDRSKGIGLIGQNGTGKSLLFKIMGSIAPFFGKDFLSTKANMMGLDVSKYMNGAALFMDDVGQDAEVKSWGNLVDVVYSVFDYRATLFENGLPMMLYFTSNLSVDGYETFAKRYDKRIFDRLTAMCELVTFGSNVSTSYRSVTRQVYPDKLKIERVIIKFVKDKMGMDFNKVVHPIVKKQTDMVLGLLRVYYARALKYKQDNDYLQYVSAFGSVDLYLNQFRILTYSSNAAKGAFEQEYLNVCKHIKELEWKVHIETPKRKTLGQRVKEGLYGNGQNLRTKKTKSVSELIKTN